MNGWGKIDSSIQENENSPNKITGEEIKRYVSEQLLDKEEVDKGLSYTVYDGKIEDKILSVEEIAGVLEEIKERYEKVSDEKVLSHFSLEEHKRARAQILIHGKDGEIKKDLYVYINKVRQDIVKGSDDFINFGTKEEQVENVKNTYIHEYGHALRKATYEELLQEAKTINKRSPENIADKDYLANLKKANIVELEEEIQAWHRGVSLTKPEERKSFYIKSEEIIEKYKREQKVNTFRACQTLGENPMEHFIEDSSYSLRYDENNKSAKPFFMLSEQEMDGLDFLDVKWEVLENSERSTVAKINGESYSFQDKEVLGLYPVLEKKVEKSIELYDFKMKEKSNKIEKNNDFSI